MCDSANIVSMRYSLLGRACRILLVLLAVGAGTLASASEVRLGVLAWLGSEEAEVEWGPLVRGLQRSLPNEHIVVRHLDLAQITAALADHEIDFVVTNPGHYVTLEAESGIARIATQVGEMQQDPAHVVGSAVVVLDSRHDLNRLQDLHRHTLAAVSADAFGGYQLIWGELMQWGLDPERGDPRPRFTGFPMSRVLDAVLAGTADAGVLRTCLLERLERDGSVPRGRLRVLSPQAQSATCRSTSRLYPGWAFAAASGTPPELTRKVLFALLSLPPDANGQAWTVPADYHPVHELFRQLQIGPYAFLRETRWAYLAHRYWPWAAGLAILLVLWGFYTLHVEHLVQRRTRELTAVLAERQSLEERVRSGQQQMEHLSRLSILGELAGTLAHELNQPLAAIGNYARSLLRRQERGKLSDEALRQAAEEIANESERAAGILGGIRSFARKRNIVREARDIADLVGEASGLLRGMLPRAPVVEVHDHLPPGQRLVLVDPLQIQQVLLNLLKNACDAQRAAGSDERIEVHLQADGDRCAVAVRDHGTGLTAELQAHLFEAFFTTKPDGLGLGLSICKTIIEAHGGALHAEAPADGKGIVFRFTVERVKIPPAAADSPLP